MDEELATIAAELYALPLADFTPSRDRRAKELAASGSALSTKVKALKKPTLAAWVVNLLATGDRDQMAQVVAIGAALREASASLDGAAMRVLSGQRRALTAALAARARELAAAAGQRVSDAVGAQVEATLTAAILDASAAEAVESGLLLAPIDPASPDDIAVALTAPSAAPSTPARHLVAVSAEQQRRLDAALAAATERRAHARDREQAARAEVDEIAARTREVAAEMDAVRAALERLDQQHSQLSRALISASAALAEAEADHRDAEAKVSSAQSARDQLPP